MLRIDLPLGAGPSLSAHCRTLVAAGHDPEEIVHVFRGGTPVFVPTRLGYFADRAVRENATESIRFTRYVPFPDAAVR